MTEKPKKIYKDGLLWSLVPAEVYGKEVYVPCNTIYHYWTLGMKNKEFKRMTENKRFTTSGYKIYDTFHDGVHWLVNEAEEIVEVMNNLDLKARERSKALSKLQKKNEQLQSEVSKLTDFIASEIEKNAKLLQENNSLKIENMRFKEEIKDLNDVLARYEEKELEE